MDSGLKPKKIQTKDKKMQFYNPDTKLTIEEQIKDVMRKPKQN